MRSTNIIWTKIDQILEKKDIINDKICQSKTEGNVTSYTSIYIHTPRCTSCIYIT